MVVALFKAGDQLPVIPLISVVGNALKAPPAQIGATGANSGVAFGKTITKSVVDVLLLQMIYLSFDETVVLFE